MHDVALKDDEGENVSVKQKTTYQLTKLGYTSLHNFSKVDVSVLKYVIQNILLLCHNISHYMVQSYGT